MRKDLILIGMPGCGKSTIGKKLADRMEMEFLDLDEEIVRLVGKPISEIFETEGEEGFRVWENRVFRQAIGKSRVIATGGGVVTREDNYPIAKEGLVIFIDRPPEKIMEDVDTESRPLLKEGRDRLLRLYGERNTLYRGWADVIVPNIKTIDEVIEMISNEVKNYETNGD